jgi:hypothetical protein
VFCDTSAVLTAVNTCAPDIKLYISGSSSLSGALTTIVTADLFETSTLPITVILDNGSLNGNATGGVKTVSAWYGLSKQYPGKRLFVVYNNSNGSGSGVSQLLAKPALIPEADVVNIGPLSTIDANTCTIDSLNTPSAPIIACTSHGPTQTDLVISDVNATELYKLETPSSGKLAATTKLTKTPLALQGFGVAVNNNLYVALQSANLAEGILPATCTAGDTSAACQPILRSADYASLISKSGTIKSAAALLNNTDATQLILARGSDLSGIQAASNIFFAYNPCRATIDTKGKAIKGVLGGELDIISATDYPVSPTVPLVVQATATTAAIVSALNAPSGYILGILGLTTVPGASDSWKFVKLDGLSPNFNGDGSLDTYQRNAFTNNDYPFAMIFYAVAPAKASAKGVAALFPNVITAVVNGFKDSTLHNLTGIGYLDGAPNSAQSLYSHPNGNNCSPFIRNSTTKFITGTIIPTPVIVDGVSSGLIYASPVTPTWTDEAGTTTTATLDGAAFSNGTVISANGAHTLVVTTTLTANGLTALTTINFLIDTIAPAPVTVTGLLSGIYNVSVTPSWRDVAGTTSTATLNGVAYTKGTIISADGVYTLVVTTTKTLNGFTALNTIDFTISLAPMSVTVSGVSAGSTYNPNSSVTPSWTDAVGTTSTAILDGAAYTNGTAISTNGAHTLQVTTTKTSNGLTALTSISFMIGSPPTPVYVTQGGLTWMPVTPPLMNWTNANAYCTGTTINGQTGWRLPTQIELSALYASGAMIGQGWSLSITWSSTPYSASDHYSVGLGSGKVYLSFDTSYGYVTCVL